MTSLTSKTLFSLIANWMIGCLKIECANRQCWIIFIPLWVLRLKKHTESLFEVWPKRKNSLYICFIIGFFFLWNSVRSFQPVERYFKFWILASQPDKIQFAVFLMKWICFWKLEIIESKVFQGLSCATMFYTNMKRCRIGSNKCDRRKNGSKFVKKFHFDMIYRLINKSLVWRHSAAQEAFLQNESSKRYRKNRVYPVFLRMAFETEIRNSLSKSRGAFVNYPYESFRK